MLFVPLDVASFQGAAVGRREMQLGQPVVACVKDAQSCLGAGQTVLAFLIYPIDWGSLGSLVVSLFLQSFDFPLGRNFE